MDARHHLRPGGIAKHLLFSRARLARRRIFRPKIGVFAILAIFPKWAAGQVGWWDIGNFYLWLHVRTDAFPFPKSGYLRFWLFPKRPDGQVGWWDTRKFFSPWMAYGRSSEESLALTLLRTFLQKCVPLTPQLALVIMSKFSMYLNRTNFRAY